MISGKQDQWNLGLTDVFEVLKIAGKFKKMVSVRIENKWKYNQYVCDNRFSTTQ